MKKKLVFDEEKNPRKNNTSRKAILLTRLISLLKNYIRDERKFRNNPDSKFSASMDHKSGIKVPPISDENSENSPLYLDFVHEPYLSIFQEFLNYYVEEATAIEDEKLLEEIKMIEDIIAGHKNITSSRKQPIFDWEKRKKEIQIKVTEMKKKTKQKSKSNSNSVDVCFLMDCTGSMSSWITTCKNKLQTIVDLISKFYSKFKINISFVGYHDHGDSPLFDLLPFTTNVSIVKDFISKNVTARGGNDIPEDICGGLRQALNLDWTAENRLIILIADAPCHGTIFHSEQDNHPNGDPNGLEPEVLLSEMHHQGIDFFFAKINSTTDKMISIWKKHYDVNDEGRSLKTFEITNDTDFIANIADSIASVITK